MIDTDRGKTTWYSLGNTTVPVSTEPFWVDNLQNPTKSILARAQVPDYESEKLEVSKELRMSDEELLKKLTPQDFLEPFFLSHVAAYVITDYERIDLFIDEWTSVRYDKVIDFFPFGTLYGIVESSSDHDLEIDSARIGFDTVGIIDTCEIV